MVHAVVQRIKDNKPPCSVPQGFPDSIPQIQYTICRVQTVLIETYILSITAALFFDQYLDICVFDKNVW